MRRNPDNNNQVLLIAAAGAALYYFWPQVSAAFTPTPTSGDYLSDDEAYPANPETPVAPTTPATPTAPATGWTAAQLALMQQLAQGTAVLQPAFQGATVPAGTTYQPGQPLPPGVSLPGNVINVLTSQPLQNPNLPNTGPTVGVRAQNPGIDPAQLSVQQKGTVAALQPVAGTGLPMRTTPPRLNGLRLRGASPEAARAAALVVAHLNNSITYDAPQVTNNSPIGPWTPGAEQLPGGCWRYGNTPVLMNCPEGATPPTPRDEANGRCLPGYTMSVTGQCASGNDQVQLAQLNSEPYVSGPVTAPPISAAILGFYVSTTGVKPGSMLGAMLGLPANQAYGTFAQGNDGFNYLMLDQVFIRQGTATQLTRPTGPIGPRPGKLQGILPSAVPVTNATLIAASSDPTIAALLANDPRGMLTIDQWNYFYTQATGVLQVAPPYPQIDPTALISAQQYQAWRQRAGVSPATAKGKLGLILDARPGAFPLGGISDGPARMPFIHPGNRNIYRIPGQGAVLGTIHQGGGAHRWARSPFPRAAGWRHAE